MKDWALLGRADDLADHGQWITGWIGIVPVLARNFGGELRGFRNVCSHRFALMLTEPAGKGPLRCPYHAWVYDADGVPKAIPFNDSDFHLDGDGRRALALARVGLTVVRGLVFAHLDASADPATPAGWLKAGLTDLPDGSVIGTDSSIRHRSTQRRGGSC